MQPIIAIFAPIGLGLYYLANKRNLFYHFKRPTYHHHTINRVVDMILLLSPIAFGFGHLTIITFIPQDNDLIEHRSVLVLNVVIVIIGAAFFILVPLKVFYCCITEPEF